MGLRYALASVAVFALYVVAGRVGLQLATVHPSATAIWPPTGIAIAACLVLGVRVWPAIFAAALVVNATSSGHLPSSLGIAVGNTLEGIVAALLIERYANGRFAFLHSATVLLFGGIALLAAMVSATVGVTTLVMTGLATATATGPIWLTWWLGDVGGAVVVAPLLILWATRMPELRSQGSTAELVVFGVAVAAVGLVTFTPVSPLATANYPIQFLVFPVLVWPVVRFGPRLAATTAAILSTVAVWGSLQGTGPWVRETANASLLILQGFMGIATMTCLVLAASVMERQRAEEALREVEERLRRAEERKVAARDEFLSVAAHELKTPLTSLQLATQYLLRELDAGRELRPGSLRTATSVLSSQTRRLGALIGQLLDTVRIQAERMDLDLTEHDVVALAQSAAAEAQATTSRHEVAVDAPASVRAKVDALRLEQVLRNLLDNAIKFSPPGKIAVDVLPDGEWVRIGVRDHGPGIPEGARDRIFERFFQARQEDRDGGGLGLGLHVSRHIVELHGGSISADFPADGGTRIIVRLPR